ncbi:MAG: hypothetical protein ACRDPM_12205 [Solirubrobacteraceae bacterium]
MASSEARGPHADPAGEPPEDALGRLEERLDRASQAAERLLADAAGRVTAGRRSAKPPLSGWQQPAPEDETRSLLGADADLLLGLFGALRDRIPPDLQQRLAEAIREVLLALRALIDWYLERTGERRADPAEVHDIPIL